MSPGHVSYHDTRPVPGRPGLWPVSLTKATRRHKTAPDRLKIRQVFLDCLKQVNRLHERAEWYNALTGNCTNTARGHIAPYNSDAKFDRRIIVNGTLDEMMYERGAIDRSLPFAELKGRSYINPVARAADRDPDFSRRIREGLPGKEIPQ